VTAGAATPLDVLDGGGALARRVAAPWFGVLWLGVLPLRAGQVYLAHVLLLLGADAGRYGDALGRVAAGVTAAFVLACWARAAYVLACRRAIGGEPPGWEGLRVPPVQLAAYLLTALLAEVLFSLLVFTVVGVPLALLLGGLAAASFHRVERPGLGPPLRELARAARGLPVLLGVALAALVGLALAALDLHFAFRIGLWLAGGVPGVDLAAWSVVLGTGHPDYLLVLGAGAALLVEPFWLAALVVYEQRLRSRDTGEDLRLAFRRLTGAA